MAVRPACPTLLLTLLCSTVLAPPAVSGQQISVSEANIAFHLFPETRVEIPVFNHTNRVVRATLAVEMLGNDSNVVIARHERVFEARPGRCIVTLDWPRDELPTQTVQFLGAYRLRYTLTPARERGFQPLQGILQMGPHMADGFGIQGYPSGEFSCARDCSFLVRVAEPNSGRALAGYDVKAEFGGDHGTVMHAVSDADGYATLHYDVPAGYARPEVMMGITVSRGPFSNGWGGEIFWRAPPHLTLSTDKHTYHPGETVRIQLALTDVNKRRWAGGNVTLTITNVGKSQELEKKKLVTSQAGEAAAEWTIPGDIKNGWFSIGAISDDEPQGNWTAKDKAKIDVIPREQAEFAVSAVPDRDYYLPGQIANLTITAAELGGAPIRKGNVSIKSEWGGAVSSGDLDDAGRYVAAVDPKAMWAWIRNGSMPGWPEPRFWEFPVDVRVSDAASVKTQFHQVVLQLAPQEIHLAVDDQPRVGSERTLGIVSSYVDNSAASVDGVVEATIPDENESCPAAQDASHRIVLGHFHTNGFGVARLVLPRSWIEYAYPKRDDGAYSSYARVPRLDVTNERATKNACILIQVRDHRSKTGSLLDRIAVLPETHFATRVSTDRALYRPGDPIRVRIESDAGLTEAAVELRTPGQELAGAQHVRLVHGRAEVTFPYAPKFRGVLTVQVYAVNALDDPNAADSWSTDVIYPTGERIKFGDRWGDELWTPDVVQPDHPGIAVPAADADRGQIAGIRKEDLLQLDPAKPIPEGLDLVAWALLGEPKSWGGWTWEYADFRHEEFDKINLAAMKPALEQIWVKNGRHAIAGEDLIMELKEVGLDFAALRDGWGMPYRIVVTPTEICVVSDGADKIPNTKDDYIAERFK